jgi:hypothetical protein
MHVYAVTNFSHEQTDHENIVPGMFMTPLSLLCRVQEIAHNFCFVLIFLFWQMLFGKFDNVMQNGRKRVKTSSRHSTTSHDSHFQRTCRHTCLDLLDFARNWHLLGMTNHYCLMLEQYAQVNNFQQSSISWRLGDLIHPTHVTWHVLVGVS